MDATSHFSPSKFLSRLGARRSLLRRSLLSLILVGLLGASGCESLPALPVELATPTAVSSSAASVETAVPVPPIPRTEVIFRVEVPENTPDGEVVYLTLMDEVTGLALNAERFPMEAAATEGEGPKAFLLSLPVAVGSVIKYRYERQTPVTTVAEHTSDGRPVRYRLFAVDGPARITDVVSRWTDTAFESPTGRIRGQATDAESGEPVPDLLIAAGGAQTRTAFDGSFQLEGLPPGIHTLVAYAKDGSYRTFQQGAEVAAESTTPTPLSLQPAPLVNVIFVVSLPENTPPAVPVRLAGSLSQLGNTFSTLGGGASGLATRMPVLEPLPDGRYSITLNLPAGAYVRYKYTLGDGFWNAEHNETGDFVLREAVVPEETAVIEDQVETWQTGEPKRITFDITVPENTPPDDVVTLQLNPLFGWMEPIPMWQLGPQRWAYILYSPLNLPSLSYRFCRNGQCEYALDAGSSAAGSAGNPLNLDVPDLLIQETLTGWNWLGGDIPATDIITPTVTPRDPFVAGIEFSTDYHPSWLAHMPAAMEGVRSDQANWAFLTPTWTYTHITPPILEPVAGQDADWFDLRTTAEQARLRGLYIAVKPTPRFPETSDAWWAEARLDYGWWLQWFEQYRTFALHHADLANRINATALVLGGDWVAPALPGGVLPDGSASGVPADAEERWRNLIAEVRSRYGGTLFWDLPFHQLDTTPAFLDAIDAVYLTWSATLAPAADTSIQSMAAEAAWMLDAGVLPVYYRYRKLVVLAVAYPSAAGAAAGCVPASDGACLPLEHFRAPNAQIGGVAPDFEEQSRLYQAVLRAIETRDWINGFVARGYYPPVALQDPSISIHGKPVEEVLRTWLPAFAIRPEP